MVNKIMLPPLIVGFLCMFVTLISAMGPIQHEFVTNDLGQVVTNAESNPSGFVIGENGLTTGGWFPMTQYVNNQTGQLGYFVYNIPTQSYQFWQYLIPNGTADVIVILNRGSGLGSLEFKGPSSTDTEQIADLLLLMQNNTITKTLNLGYAPYIGDPITNPFAGGSANYSYVLTIVAMNENSLIDALNQGYGYIVYLTGEKLSSTGSVGDIFSSNGIMVILIAALVIGGVAAITVFSSGIDFFGQKLIFVSAAYVVLWFILSAGMYNMIIAIPVVGIMIWLILTLMYFLGVVQEVLGGD